MCLIDTRGNIQEVDIKFSSCNYSILRNMFASRVIVLFLSAVLYDVSCSGGRDERLPMGMDDSDHNTLFKALEEGSITMPKKCRTPQVRGVYRLLQSRKYAIKECVHPVTGENTKVVVSTYRTPVA